MPRLDASLLQEVESLTRGKTLGFYSQADGVMRLLTRENVSAVMGALPMEFLDEFVSLARDIYIPEGERIVIKWAPMPEACLAALRGWWRERMVEPDGYAEARAELLSDRALRRIVANYDMRPYFPLSRTVGEPGTTSDVGNRFELLELAREILRLRQEAAVAEKDDDARTVR